MHAHFDRPSAFRRFYDDEIVVEAQRAGRSVKGTFKACVFDSGFAEPFADADAETDVRSFSVSVRAGDWIDAKPPQVGDRIALVREGFSYSLAVKSVSPGVGDWCMDAREVAK